MEAHDRDRESRGGLRRAVATAFLGVAVAAAIVAPWTRRGWLLLLDWVPGPRAIGPTGAAALPTGPAFLLPARALHAVFGATVGWLVIAIALAVATAGAAQLVRGSWPARIAAGVGYGWNPFVFDRLAVGQVSVLAGYALLPWLASAALRARNRRDVLLVAMWWAAAAACTLHFLWIGGVLLACIAIVRSASAEWKRVLIASVCVLAFVAAVTGAWFALVHGTGPSRGDARVLKSFATTSDPDLGRSLGLLAQQGFWRTVVTRPRDDLDAFFPVVAGLSIFVAAAGLLKARGKMVALAFAALIGWLLAHGDAVIGYRALFDHVPGFGVMREAQKWDMLVCLAIAAGTGAFAEWLTRTRARAFAIAVVAVPLALAPTLAWGLSNRIGPSRYPASWRDVRTAVDALPGDVVVLPWEQYVRPGITGNRTIANPASSYFGCDVLVSRDPGVAGLRADTGLRAQIAAVVQTAFADVQSGRPLRLGAGLGRLGIHALLVTADGSGLPLERDPALTRTVTGDHLALYVISMYHPTTHLTRCLAD